MKQKIRNKIFESNSSSSHTLVILNQKEYDLLKKEYKKGKEVYFDIDSKHIDDEKVYSEEMLEKEYGSYYDSPGHIVRILAQGEILEGRYAKCDPYDESCVNGVISCDTKYGKIYILSGDWME